MKVHEIMTRDVHTLSPQSTLTETAQAMARWDTGSVIIEDNDRIAGIITDRDLVIRGLAKNLAVHHAVGNIMSTDIHYCFEDEDVQKVVEVMADLQLRRLPVLNRAKRLVGIVSLGNIASARNQQASATVLYGVAQAH